MNDILNTCPYRLFRSVNLNIPFNNIFSSANGDQIFKINDTVIECGFKLYRTTEGAWLTYNNTKLPKLKNDIIAVHDFMLSESDGIELRTYNALDRLKEELCNLVLTNIRSFRLIDNQFETIYTGNSSVTIYSSDGIIFVPQCKIASFIELETYDGCTADPRIKYQNSNYTNFGYLTKSGVIRTDNEINCKNKKSWIRKIGNSIALIDKKNVSLVKTLNFFPSNQVISEVDRLTFSHDPAINEISVDTEPSYIKPMNDSLNDENNNLNINSEFSLGFKKFTNLVLPSIINYRPLIYIIAFVLFILIILFIFFKFCRERLCSFKIFNSKTMSSKKKQVVVSNEISVLNKNDKQMMNLSNNDNTSDIYVF